MKSYLAMGLFVSIESVVVPSPAVERGVGIECGDGHWLDILGSIGLFGQKHWLFRLVGLGGSITWLWWTIAWLGSSVGWLRDAVCGLRMAIGGLRMAVSGLWVAICGLWVAIGWGRVAIGGSRVAVSRGRVAIGRTYFGNAKC